MVLTRIEFVDNRVTYLENKIRILEKQIADIQQVCVFLDEKIRELK